MSKLQQVILSEQISLSLIPFDPIQRRSTEVSKNGKYGTDENDEFECQNVVKFSIGKEEAVGSGMGTGEVGEEEESCCGD